MKRRAPEDRVVLLEGAGLSRGFNGEPEIFPGQESLDLELPEASAIYALFRQQLVPTAGPQSVGDIMAAARRYFTATGRRVTFEYVLLADVNDSMDDARRLPELLRGIPSKLNLIPWNPHPLSHFRRPSDKTIEAFQNELKARGLAVYVRRSRGRDIDAACGQLAAKKAEPLVQLRA